MGIPYMTNKTKTKRKSNNKRTKKNTPFQDVGAIVGSAVGNLFGMKQGKGIGRWLGQGIGAIFGSGDYQMVGQPANYNVLTNDRQIPKFQSSDRTNVVCHREYITDILSTRSFNNRTYRINPGDPMTFPWLHSLADQYQQYRIHGMIFEFRPLTTDFAGSGQPGVVVMATNYNAEDPPYNSKVAMENSEFAVSIKPTMPVIHAIECDPRETTITKLYVDKFNDKDPRFSDLGLFQLATQGHSADDVVLGELWVSYCIEFYKPKLSQEVGGVMSFEAFRGLTSSTDPYGSISISQRGDFPVSVTKDSISFNSMPNQKWLATIMWIGEVAGANSGQAPPSILGATYENVFFGDTRSSYFSPEVGAASKQLTMALAFKAANEPTRVLIGAPTVLGLATTNTYVTITLTRIDDTL
jgi:hypothetical protein